MTQNPVEYGFPGPGNPLGTPLAQKGHGMISQELLLKLDLLRFSDYFFLPGIDALTRTYAGYQLSFLCSNFTNINPSSALKRNLRFLDPGVLAK